MLQAEQEKKVVTREETTTIWSDIPRMIADCPGLSEAQASRLIDAVRGNERQLFSILEQVGLVLDHQKKPGLQVEVQKLREQLTRFNNTSELRVERAKRTTARDELTGLHSAKYFKQHLQRRLEGDTGEREFCLVFLDGRGLKEINTRFGHAVGSLFLETIGNILKQTRLNTYDRLCRYGGDEFALLLGSAGLKRAEGVLVRVFDAIQTSSTLKDYPVGMDAGIVHVVLGPVSQRAPYAAQLREAIITEGSLLMSTGKKKAKKRGEAYSRSKCSYRIANGGIKPFVPNV